MSDSIFVMIPYTNVFFEIYEKAIKPAIEENGFKSVIGSDQNFTGPVIDEIQEQIKKAKLCIADLSKNNPNVMYEVALAHSYNKQVILLTQDKQETVPFDIRHHRLIEYSITDNNFTISLKGRIKSTINSRREEAPVNLLKLMLVPSSIPVDELDYFVVASPLSYKVAYGIKGGWKKNVTTLSDHVGIRGLMQAFGLMFGLDRLPELINPDDFVKEAINYPMNMCCIGSPKANRWTGLIMDMFFETKIPKWDFRLDPDSKSFQNPKVMIRRNDIIYTPATTPVNKRPTEWDFGLVIRGTNPYNSAGLFFVLAGRSALGTEAACLAVTEPTCLKTLLEKLKFEKFDINNHEKAWCAVVSIECNRKGPEYGSDISSFVVHEVVELRKA